MNLTENEMSSQGKKERKSNFFNEKVENQSNGLNIYLWWGLGFVVDVWFLLCFVLFLDY